MTKYQPSQRLLDQLERTFIYHSPKMDQPQRYSELRAAAGDLARMMAQSCPESRELSLALTHLEQSIMFANAAIARNE